VAGATRRCAVYRITGVLVYALRFLARVLGVAWEFRSGSVAAARRSVAGIGCLLWISACRLTEKDLARRAWHADGGGRECQ
jgi:hypothetical protein